jgi:hypothetical protein
MFGTRHPADGPGKDQKDMGGLMPESDLFGITLPRRTKTPKYTWFRLRSFSKSGYVAAQFGANISERGVEAASQSLRASGGAEGNQTDNQGVFNQVLTLFATDQILERHVQLYKQYIHLCPLRMAHDTPSGLKVNPLLRPSEFPLSCKQDGETVLPPQDIPVTFSKLL